MARIPDEEIERLKREIPIERLVSGFGVELTGTGANLVGRCPFHDDRTPSLIVTPETNLWRCMGACNVGGSSIDWVMKTRGVSFRHAVELLRADHPSLAAGDARVVRKLVTHQYRVEGPVMIFLTTTAIDLDEELLNRCLVLSVNEEREQTQAIHRLQREQQTLEGLLRRQERRDIIGRQQNAQRLLRPLFVANPYAQDLTFLDTQLRSRRDHMKYLTLIRAIALLHQHQRPVRTATHNGKTIEYIEVTPADIEVANRLVSEVLGRSLDELPPQTRRLLALIGELVTAECRRLKMERSDFRFSRRDVRRHSGWSATQIRVHLDRLTELEYVIVHHGGRGQSFVYELLCQSSESYRYDLNLAGPEAHLTGSKRPQNGGVTAPWRTHETRMNTGANGVLHEKRRNGTDTGIGANGVVTLAPFVGIGAQ